ncbi:hypothetical protein [Rosistilla carotiformis]|uniref:hypothetical protein n=1 Tax=Rosistilla carotiformis TaxID=2528017 RepID=UPI0011A90827|nr:hypothetical protein [Rosistilla carotiformis]
MQGSTFWKVDPSVVQNLPSKTRSFLGRNQIERWAFVGTVVTFQSVPLLGHVAREEPAFFAKVESVGLYAEPTLKTLRHRFDLQSLPAPVLLNEGHEVIGEKGQPIPLDELALAGLAANDPTFEVHPEFWGALWGHISKLDEERYAAINRVVKESFQANHAVANFARLNQEPDEEQRNKAISILAGLQAQGDEMLAPSRRPFFPTYLGRNGRYAHEKVETLSPQQQSCLTNWLVKRNQVAEDRFQILVQVQTNGDTDEPTVIDHPHRPELHEKLQELGAKPDHHYSLNENLAFDQRGRLSKKGTQTNLFRAPGTAYKSLQFLLDFGFPVDTLVRKLPKEVVDKSLALKPDDIPIAVKGEFKVTGLEVHENLIGDQPYVVLKANPQKLIALSDEKTIIFSEALDVGSLNKLAANKPKRAIPTVPSDQSGPHRFTPQNVLPLIGKIAPEFLENEQQLDQLMAMRWRLENSGMSGVTSDGVRFFKKGSRQLPAFEERKPQADEFKAWTRRWSEALPEDFAVQFENFEFVGNDKSIRSPAILSGGQPYRWLTIDLRISDIIYELNNPERIHPPMPAEEISAISELLSLAPPDVFLDQQYAIPDAKGEISQWPAASNRRIAGIPVANQSEPIFPLLRFDKEIWPPENAELSASTQNPKLEVVLHPETFELLDKPPRHHWIDGYWRYRRTAPQDDRMRDAGKYAIIGMRLKSARLVDPATGKTVLPLVLKEYRAIKERVVEKAQPPKPAKEDSGSKQFDKSIAGVKLGMSFDDAEKAIQEHLDVGRVLVADRGLSKQPTPADFKKIQPYTSGRLFVSKDGRQYMAIFDEPPAASRKVVAMWMRRHVSDQEMASRLWRGALIKSLTDQYGSARENFNNGNSASGLPISSFWREKRHDSQVLALPSGIGKESLWLENGERTTWRPPGQVEEGAKFSQDAKMLLPELNSNHLVSRSWQPPGRAEIQDDAIINASGPALGSTIEMPHWGAGGSLTPDDSLNPMVTTWIVDPPAYIKYYRESQALVKASK